MTDVIEKMCEAFWNENVPKYQWSRIPHNSLTRRHYEKYMRAAIAALAKNIDDKMMRAGEEAFDGGWTDGDGSEEWRKYFRNALVGSLHSLLQNE